MSREMLADSLRPYGPLVALGVGDVLATRQILRKIGVTAIVATPDGPGAWRFEGRRTSGVSYTQGPVWGLRGPWVYRLPWWSHSRAASREPSLARPE
jgi:hypothetical protein